jgi:hypothetical protein
MGAENITETEKWNLWRLDFNGIQKLVDPTVSV